MAKARRVRRRIPALRIRAKPYKFTSSKRVIGKSVFANNCSKVMEKKDWEGAICSVCMEYPHNAVLLLCSSHDKGCRPYMCGTSFRYSNCLDQYKKASAKLAASRSHQQQPITSKCELANLKCPLCRGQVKGWTIVQRARDDMNLKRRSCMQENCSFAGTFKDLRKHMKTDHPCATPREVDPDGERRWRRLEVEQDRDDVMSTIRSTMPGATVFGDYVIERGAYGSDSDDEDDDVAGEQRDEDGRIDTGMGRNLVNIFLMLQAFGASGNNDTESPFASDTLHDLISNQSNVEASGEEEEEEEEEDGATALENELRRRRRVLLGSSVSYRRRRDREANQNSGHRR
ncbi:unnamed protein product [Cochlearia groenlandica]